MPQRPGERSQNWDHTPLDGLPLPQPACQIRGLEASVDSLRQPARQIRGLEASANRPACQIRGADRGCLWRAAWDGRRPLGIEDHQVPGVIHFCHRAEAFVHAISHVNPVRTPFELSSSAAISTLLHLAPLGRS